MNRSFQYYASLLLIAWPTLIGMVFILRDNSFAALVNAYILKESRLLSNTLVLVMLVVIILLVFRTIRYSTTLKTLTELRTFDSRFILSMSSLMDIRNGDDQAHVRSIVAVILGQFLQLRKFRSCGISIYRPNKLNQYLTPWVSSGTPSDRSSETCFYIDSPDFSKPTVPVGTVGTAYLKGETIIVHVSSDGVSDHNLYISTSTRKPSYRSFICVPIFYGDSRQPMGVLRIFSSKKRTFDSPTSKLLSKELAFRLSILLSSSTKKFQKESYRLRFSSST